MIKKTLGLLTVLLGFVGVSFGYTVVGNGGQMEVVPPDTAILGSYVYVFNNNGNISTDNYGQYLIWYNKDGSNNYNYVYGRIDGKLYFVGTYQNNVQKQGFVQKFSVCSDSDTTNSSKCLNLSITAEDFYSLNPNITKIIVGNPQGSSLQSTTAGNFPVRLCYFNSNDSQYYCVQNAIRTNGYVDNPLNNSLGFTNINSLSNGNWGSSPFSPSRPVIPDYSIGTGRQLMNYEVLMGFEYMGLSREYCYGGFDIDNIFLPSEQFSDFSGYSFGNGATLFDLYNSYGGGLTIKSFLSNYYQSFLNAQLSNFHNKSKALLMIFQQYQSANDREWGSFKLDDLMDYCDLYFNLVNNNRENDGDIYTGNSQNAINSYRLNRKIPEGGFINTGVLGTGNFTGFESADAFFGRLTNLFQSNVNGVNGDFSPMIPSYIVVFMLAFILIRIISH